MRLNSCPANGVAGRPSAMARASATVRARSRTGVPTASAAAAGSGTVKTRRSSSSRLPAASRTAICSCTAPGGDGNESVPRSNRASNARSPPAPLTPTDTVRDGSARPTEEGRAAARGDHATVTAGPPSARRPLPTHTSTIRSARAFASTAIAPVTSAGIASAAASSVRACSTSLAFGAQ